MAMKAREYGEADFFDRSKIAQSRVYDIQREERHQPQSAEFFGNGLLDLKGNEARALEELLDTLTDAKEYGSILNSRWL